MPSKGPAEERQATRRCLPLGNSTKVQSPCPTLMKLRTRSLAAVIDAGLALRAYGWSTVVAVVVPGVGLV